MAEQVAVDEAELEGLQQPRHAAHVDVRLVEEPLEGRLGARVDRQGVRKEVVHLGWGGRSVEMRHRRRVGRRVASEETEAGAPCGWCGTASPTRGVPCGT